jgi:phosphoenolpyruvate---glycerone phosphotransferase subunit DhaL
MAESFIGEQVAEAIRRACDGLKTNGEYLTSLDRALGDGDMGITFTRIADALTEYTTTAATNDVGKLLANAGMVANKAGPSTMGTLTATALMRAGKELMGKADISTSDIGNLFRVVAVGMKERGKAALGDKTVLDAIFPSSEAFSASIEKGEPLVEAAKAALTAAKQGRDQVTPLRSKVGRAAWLGERTEGCVDPGCAALVIVLEALCRI